MAYKNNWMDYSYSVSKYQLIVNTLKTIIMIFGPNHKEEIHFFMNKCEIDVCKSYKYLGVVFNSVCNSRGNMLREMLDYTSEKVRKATFPALKKCNLIGKSPPKVGFHLFYNMYYQL